MKSLIQKLSVLCIVLLNQAAFAAVDSSPVGHWKTIDDETGQAKSILAIYETPSHTLEAKVLTLFHPAKTLCTACKGDKHNQPILGMVVMTDLKQDKEKPELWKNGTILDPKVGKTYHCHLTVADHGQELRVRGYIGVPLLGRTQTWYRVE